MDGVARNRALHIGTAAALLLSALILYVVAYAARSSRVMTFPYVAGHGPTQRQVRVFRSRWEALIFLPAEQIESLWIGEQIDSASPVR